jgi:hypothetical protein
MGEPMVHKYPDSPIARSYLALATTVRQELEKFKNMPGLPGLEM